MNYAFDKLVGVLISATMMKSTVPLCCYSIQARAAATAAGGVFDHLQICAKVKARREGDSSAPTKRIAFCRLGPYKRVDGDAQVGPLTSSVTSGS